MGNARKKVSADLQLEGEYYLAGEEGLSNGVHAAGGDAGEEGEEGVGGGGWSGGGGENGHANGSVRRKLNSCSGLADVGPYTPGTSCASALASTEENRAVFAVTTDAAVLFLFWDVVRRVVLCISS